MAYQVEIISPSEKERLFEEYSGRYLYTKKANIYGCCIKLLTDLEDVRDLWEENFYTADENIRSHGRLVVLREEGEQMHIKYDPYTNTAFLINVDYYGWIKSIALAIAGDVLEDEHGIYSVHGAAIDVGGRGVSIIAPPKTGKTTHSWGLLRLKEARLVTDDWYFVRLHERGALAFGSEKNCYVEADIGGIWKEYEGILDKAMFDKSGRAIVNVRWAVGGGGVIAMTTLKKIIMLKRDSGDPTVSRRLSVDEAMDYLIGNDFCNPHQLVKDERKFSLRKRFFEKLFSATDVFLVNTVKPPLETHAEIVKLVME